MSSKFYVVCSECGSEDVSFDCYSRWDFDKQGWVITDHGDYSYCGTCESECNTDDLNDEYVDKYVPGTTVAVMVDEVYGGYNASFAIDNTAGEKYFVYCPKHANPYRSWGTGVTDKEKELHRSWNGYVHRGDLVVLRKMDDSWIWEVVVDADAIKETEAANQVACN